MSATISALAPQKYDMYIERKRIKINRICSIKKTWFGARQKRKCPWNLPILVISKLFEQGVGDALNLGEFHCKCKMEGYKIGVNKEKHTKRFKRSWGQSTKNKSWNPIRMHFASCYCNPMCCVKIVFGPFFLCYSSCHKSTAGQWQWERSCITCAMAKHTPVKYARFFFWEAKGGSCRCHLPWSKSVATKVRKFV